MKQLARVFHFLYTDSSYLDDSTLNVSPYETAYCLKEALKDWIADEELERLIIVTSLSSRISDFYFEGYSKEQVDSFQSFILIRFGVQINHRLIRIGMPKALTKDCLSAVFLFHELGHFVDDELKISERIFFAKYSKPPYLFASEEEVQFFYHTKEYFADLFAAQYIGNSSCLYLMQIAPDAIDSLTHPATCERNRFTNLFLDGEPFEILDQFQNALKKAGCGLLEIRHLTLRTEDSGFAKLQAHLVQNSEMLFSLFKLGWDSWTLSDANFLREFEPRQRFYILNNLIEKSVSNYEVSTLWKQ
jgi:hypothetical protein